MCGNWVGRLFRQSYRLRGGRERGETLLSGERSSLYGESMRCGVRYTQIDGADLALRSIDASKRAIDSDVGHGLAR